MKVYPVKFEITDDAHFLLAVVDLLDTSSAAVDIKTVVSRRTWPELSAKIAECFVVRRELGWYEQQGDADCVEDAIKLMNAMDAAHKALQEVMSP